MEPEISAFDAAIDAHDEALQARKLDIWVGAEPTFTNRQSHSAEWLTDALGKSKQKYALRILQRLAQNNPHALILRTLGRQYAEEQRPRWNLGLYQLRSGEVLATGLPEEPLISTKTNSADALEQFWQQLISVLDSEGWHAKGFQLDAPMGMRILFRIDEESFRADAELDPRLARTSPHLDCIPLKGAQDELAEEGLYMVSLGYTELQQGEPDQACIEIPAFTDVLQFTRFLKCVALAAQKADLLTLSWKGFSPPVDETIAWTTLTPDPAVLEINAAPAPDARQFLQFSRELFKLTSKEQLSPYRLQYNGQISDSGGGGQFTLGGPDPQRSPFFNQPQLTSRLIRYLNHHPALSYWFAPLYVGSSSQSPRADENVRESFSELALAQYQLARIEQPEAEFIWRSLSPFLVDTSGNAHRSELNIEKLWNPYLPQRGCLGLVEFRAFRMSPDAETMTSIAVLLRAIAAMLTDLDVKPDLIDWGSQLHDRFALPFYLREDLQQVFEELEQAGLGPGTPIIERLSDQSYRYIGYTDFADCRLEVSQALEFWPLLGDAATQGGGSRLVDASTSRLQVTLHFTSTSQNDNPGEWTLLAGSYRVPMRQENHEKGIILVAGLRYRSFVPWSGLHPGITAQGPIVLTLIPPGAQKCIRVSLHEWQPQQLPYAGLPESLEEAQNRAAERFVVEQLDVSDIPEAFDPPAQALTGYCLDLRRC